MSPSRRRAWIRAVRRDAEAGGDRVFGIWVDGRLAGGCGLHRRIGPGGLELGYWVHRDFVHRGVATSAVRRLVELAFADPAIDRAEIHHDAANGASAGVARAAGFRHVEDRADERSAPAESGVERIWRLTREECEARGSDAARRRPPPAHG